MSDPGVTDSVRERDERDARFFAWDVPGDAHVVALVHEADEAERSATVADAIATSVARRREHTLLLSAEAGPSPLDELLGASGSQGLPAALEGRVRLTDVAVQRVDRPFVYLPGGNDGSAMRALLEDQVLASFVERVRERGGTLFIMVSDETLKVNALRALIDGYVALGEVDLSEGESGLSQFGRVRFDNGDPSPAKENGGAPRLADIPGLPPLPDLSDHPPESEGTASVPEPADAGPSDTDRAASGDAPSRPAEREAADPEPVATEDDEPAVGTGETPAGDQWQRHRVPPAFPIARVGLGVGAVAVILATWWAITGGLGGSGAADDGEAGVVSAASAASPAEGTGAVFDEAAARAAFDAAPPLGYSVMIASFAASGDARERLDELRRAGSGLYFLSPTPVRGVLYHRVFAGALGSRGEAQSLMDALVDSGVKDEAGAWHLRPAVLAYDLGLFPDRGASDRRVADLEERGIPAYALTAPAPTGDVWRVYGGAYVDAREAAPMSELLTEAGEPADLIERRGVVP